MNLLAYSLGHSAGIKSASKEKRKSRALPIAGAAAGASLPLASLAQYLTRDYPAYKKVLDSTPIVRDPDEAAKLMRSGDIAASLTSPSLTHFPRYGTVITGSPAYHAMLIGGSDAKITAGGQLGAIEGGWTWPGKSPSLTAAAPGIFNRLYGAANAVQNNRSEDSRTGWLDDFRASLKDRDKAADTMRAIQLELAGVKKDPARLSAALNLNKDLSEQLEPMVVMRSKVAPVDAATNVNKQMQQSAGVPYNEYNATIGGLSRLMAPTIPSADKSVCDSSSEFCTSPVARYLKSIGTPADVAEAKLMPADLIRQESLKPEFIYSNKFSDASPTAADTRTKLTNWLQTGRKDRVLLGLAAAGLLGGVGYGAGALAGKLVNKYKERKKQRIEQ